MGAVLTQHTLSHVPESRITIQYQASSDRAGFIVENCDFDTFEKELDSDPSVVDYQLVSDFATHRIYNVEAVTDPPLISVILAELGIQIISATSRESEADWLLRLRCPDRESLATFCDYCTEHRIDFRLERLYLETASDRGGAASSGGSELLSEKQQDAIEYAFDEGYFDVPRKTNLSSLSEELGVSSQAVSERIRRALRTLLEVHIDHQRE